MTLKNFKQNDWILDFDRCNYFDRYDFFKKSNEKLRVQWLSHFFGPSLSHSSGFQFSY